MAVNIKNKLFETRDYSIFKRSRGNRPVDKAHVAQLKKLIADKDIGDPVKVNHDVYGFNDTAGNNKYRVNAITLNADSTVDVVLEEYAPDSVYLENN